MEAILISDSHGKTDRVRRVLDMHPDATHVLFCGDGLSDIDAVFEEFPRKIFVSVRGNCDLFSADPAPDERAFSLFGIAVLMAHGHTLGVKGGLGAAARRGAEEKADIFLFGHTHIPTDECFRVGDRTVHLFNPGSLGRPYDGRPSFGVLTVRENGYLLSHGYLK